MMNFISSNINQSIKARIRATFLAQSRTSDLTINSHIQFPGLSQTKLCPDKIELMTSWDRLMSLNNFRSPSPYFSIAIRNPTQQVSDMRSMEVERFPGILTPLRIIPCIACFPGGNTEWNHLVLYPYGECSLTSNQGNIKIKSLFSLLMQKGLTGQRC